MNKKLRTIMLFIFAFITIFVFSDNILALKWDDGNDYIYFGDEKREKSSLSEWRRDEDEGKEIEQVCMYYQDDEVTAKYEIGDDLDDINYIFIYKDGTASAATDIGHSNALAMKRNIAYDSTFLFVGYHNVGFDGYYKNDKNYRGIRNWCANKDLENSGVVNNCSEYDASAAYQKTKKCPAFMVRVSRGSDYFDHRVEYHYFLSKSDKIYEFDNLYSYADKIQPDHHSGGIYRYYNILEPVLKEESFDECTYGEKGKDDILLKFRIKKNDAGYTYLEKDEGDTKNFGSDHKLSGINMSGSFLSTVYLNALNSGCPHSIQVCRSDTEDHQASNLSIFGEIGGMGIEKCPIGDEEPIPLECKGDNCNSESYCLAYNDYVEELDKLLTEYKALTTANERREKLNEYNDAKDRFNAWCVSALSYGSYIETGCLDKCIHRAIDIADKETTAGLRSPYSAKAKCNVGEQIVLMIYNVLKWAKYIAPVLVIILSILDFIKALAAQSDDEMKKAQGRFVKRLVVAALLFLIPLIINFALKTFGFYNSGCDITDLFSSSK